MDDADEPAPARHGLSVSAWCVVAAFGAYFCMYAFRKPFTAGAYADWSLGGVGYKTVLVTAQVLGYTLSKFLGIKVVSEVAPHKRAVRLLTLIAGAEVALLLFGLTPAPFNFLWLFVNGAFLGMVFGLALGFLEGRRHTEALAAGLCTSFIVADGVAAPPISRPRPPARAGGRRGPRATRRGNSRPHHLLHAVPQRLAHARRPAGGADADGAGARDRRPHRRVRTGRSAGRCGGGAGGRRRPRHVGRRGRVRRVFLQRRRLAAEV